MRGGFEGGRLLRSEIRGGRRWVRRSIGSRRGRRVWVMEKTLCILVGGRWGDVGQFLK